MGIKGLIPLLGSIQQDRNIKEYRGKSVAVDTYCWLHKATYSCSYELCLGRPTTRYVDYCVRKVQLLLSFGITPIMVFDGGKLKMKTGQEIEREENRERSKKKGLALLGRGKSKEATKCFQRAVDVTPKMAYNLIKELKSLGVKCIVAPYEADAQLGFLSISGRVDTVISEDSDLLLFGCKRVFFKMGNNGDGKEICLNDLPHVSSVNFGNWTQKMFAEMCILSGCDYLPSINRIGLKKSHDLISHYRGISRALEYLRSDGKYIVPESYEEEAEKALLTFYHQTVYDDLEKKLVSLNKKPKCLEVKDLSFLGKIFDNDLAIGICEGFIDPISKMPFDVMEKIDYSKLKKTIPKLIDNVRKVKKVKKMKNLKIKEKKVEITKWVKMIDIKEKKKVLVGKNIKRIQTEKVIVSNKNHFESEEEINMEEVNEIINAPTPEKIISPFLSARRLTRRRNYGGFNFMKDI